MGEPGRALPQTVLRAATDRRLLDETIRRGRTTRAELAEVTGYSRPTVSEAVRRLVEQGLLDASGLNETGRRGRVGTFYALGARAGWVLALEVGQAGVRARATDLAGAVLHEDAHSPATQGDVAGLVSSARLLVRGALDLGLDSTAAGRGPLRAIGVSVANPVDPDSHAILPLDCLTFPEGAPAPDRMLADLTSAPVLVDNDVNLAALAEHRLAGESGFAYVFVGAGLGVGLFLNGHLVRGAHGLAGEIGFLPGATSPTLADELTVEPIGRLDAPSTDVADVVALLDQGSEAAVRRLASAVARAIVSVAAVVDPALFLLGGPVGTHPALLPAVRELVAFPARIRIEHGTLGGDAALTGAVQLALEHARAAAINP